MRDAIQQALIKDGFVSEDTIVFVNGDSSGVVSGAPVLTTTATAASATGNYAITGALCTLAAANYSFSLTNGTLTVTPEDARDRARALVRAA